MEGNIRVNMTSQGICRRLVALVVAAGLLASACSRQGAGSTAGMSPETSSTLQTSGAAAGTTTPSAPSSDDTSPPPASSRTPTDAGQSPASAESAQALPAPYAVAGKEVLAAVRAAASISRLPDDLTPTLKKAGDDSGGAIAAQRPGCYPQDRQVDVPDSCVWGDPDGSRRVVLLGDSHAAMWLSAFDAIGMRLHWKVLLLSKISCPPPYLSFFNFNAKTSYPECDEWHDLTIARVNQLKPDLVVLTGDTRNPKDGQYQPISRDAWGDGLLKTMALMTGAAKIAVLGDIPRIGKDPFDTSGPECLAAHADDIQQCSSSTVAVRAKLYFDAERSAAERAGALYLDVVPWFCSDVCTAVVGSMVVYRNEAHITATYATYLSGALQELLEPYVGHG